MVEKRNKRIVRCAIYTRKSSYVGLDGPLSSLETQRDVCRAYIKCQSHRDWREVAERYDDGGYSGGNLKRPGLKRLLRDIEAGRVDVIVIYKLDRLSRSLADFLRLMEVLERYDASFVSVTQTFDTSDSMGRLMLNILLTFAQFERELTSERIRDRFVEKRRRGFFCGGAPPLGYIVQQNGKLAPDPERAQTIRDLFQDLHDMSVTQLTRRLEEKGFTLPLRKSKKGNVLGGTKCDLSRVLRILKNPIYAGHYCAGDELEQCDIEPLVSLEQWRSCQEILATRYLHKHDTHRNFLLGILHDQQGRRMRMNRTDKGRDKRRRYISQPAAWAGKAPRSLVGADRVEKLAISALQAFLVDRVALKRAVLSLGSYSVETGRILRRGSLAARRIGTMEPIHLRECLLALVPRAEAAASELRLLVDCYELSRFLAWDGVGIFKRCEVRPQGVDRFRMVYASGLLVQESSRPRHLIEPRGGGELHPDKELIALLNQAFEFRRLLLENRSLSVAQIANNRKMGARHFSRILRLNYLAPDIQASILDGAQPSGLTRNKLLFSSLPLDWGQQRQLWGFPDPMSN